MSRMCGPTQSGSCVAKTVYAARMCGSYVAGLSEHDVTNTSPAVNDGGGVGASELCVQDAVNDGVDAAAGPERQRRQHVDSAVKHGTSVGQVCDGERQVGQSERQKDGENHVQRARALSLTALQLRQPPCRQFAELLAKQSTT